LFDPTISERTCSANRQNMMKIKRHAEYTLMTCSTEERTTKNNGYIAIRKPTDYGTAIWMSHFRISVDPSASTTWPCLRHQNPRIAYRFPALSRRPFSSETPACHPALNLLLRFLMDASGWDVTVAFVTAPKSYHR